MLVACAVIINNSSVLVARRPPHKNQGGKWEFPGGKVHHDETPEACIVRELAEELGVTVTAEGRLQEVTHEYPDFTIRLLPLLCRITGGRITLLEHTEIRWLRAEELSALDLCSADRLVLEQVSSLFPQKG